jgi:hypothetical protein
MEKSSWETWCAADETWCAADERERERIFNKLCELLAEGVALNAEEIKHSIRLGLLRIEYDERRDSFEIVPTALLGNVH